MRSLVRGLLLGPLFLVALSVTSYAQTNHFVYTNNNADGPNSVSGWMVGAGGALTPVAGSPFSTGGDGAGTGFFSTVGVQALLVGNYLYATNDGDSVGMGGNTTVAGFAINPTTGVLTAVPGSPFATDGTQPAFGTSLAATPDGAFLYVNNPGDASITVYSIAGNGALTKVSTFLLGTTGALSIRMSADGNFLFGALYFDDAVAVLSVNPMTGALAHVTGSPFALADTGAGFAGPTALEVNCAGDLLFVADANSATTTTVSVLDIDQMTGALTEIAGSPFQIGTGGNSNTLTLSEDDQYLYVGNQSTNTVTALQVGVGGTLSAVPGSPFANASGTVAPETMAVDRAGRFLYVANQTATGTPAAGSVTVYLINAFTGALTLQSPSATSNGVASFLPSVAAFPSKTCNPCGFDDTFDGTAGTTPAGWSAVSGSPWELDGMGAFVNPSGPASFNSTAANDEVVTSGDEVYTVNLTRTGIPQGSPYGLILRGDATAAANGRWNNGYGFFITRNSKWFIYRWTPTTVTLLATGTAPAKIVNNDTPANTQATNTLRVVASGSTFTFFANNLTMPLGSVTDATFTSGQVGVYIRREGVGVDDDLRVNSAVLTCSAGGMVGAKAEARSSAPSAPVGSVEVAERPPTRLSRRRR
jgi:6-phosphogluconolactonase (cycloisomerase 2 family)